MPSVSVIIPTTCELRRWPQLKRAIKSVQTNQSVEAKIIAVVNGNVVDDSCYQELCEMIGVVVIYRAEGSAPLAQYAGRVIVETEFFAFLDDDDEYLPGALHQRLKPLLSDATLDFTVSNGVRCLEGKDQPMDLDASAINANPLVALNGKNWMASCGGLFRTYSVTAEYFSDPAPYLEWTYLAYRLATSLRMYFVDEPTYRIHDSAVSLSKSDAYRDAELNVLQRILALPLPLSVRHAVRLKLGRVYHDTAERYREKGHLSRAWTYHFKSLFSPGGYLFLPYSRKLLVPQFSRMPERNQ